MASSKQAPKRARPPSKRKPSPPRTEGRRRPQDHPNYQKDLPPQFLQNTNPRQNQTY